MISEYKIAETSAFSNLTDIADSTVRTANNRVILRKHVQMKKRSERRKHCALAVVIKAEPKNFALPRRRPLPGDAGRPKLNQLEMVTTITYTDPVW